MTNKKKVNPTSPRLSKLPLSNNKENGQTKSSKLRSKFPVKSDATSSSYQRV